MPSETQSIHYCTYFDHRYLARALCLYDSLCEHSPPFIWHILALTEQCEQQLFHLNLPHIQITPLSKLETTKPELQEAKNNRSTIEYYFTLTSAFCKYLIDSCPSGSLLTYLDSDLYFFQSPQPVLDELENSSIGIIEHRFSKANQEMIRHGRFNVGWVSFRNDDRGRRCLDDWYAKCLEWCYDRLEGDRFADQKYLDAWPELFAGVRIIEHRGANVGPWDVADFRLKRDNTSGKAPITIDGTPLVFYHFQNVRRIGFQTYRTGFDVYNVELLQRRQIVLQIYLPYLRHLKIKERSLQRLNSIARSEQESELRQGMPILSGSRLLAMLRFPMKYFRMVLRYNWITLWR